MARIVGNLGISVNGLLHVKPSSPFVGVTASYRAFPVTDGLLDIELPPTPRGIVYFVDFQAEGVFEQPRPQERWAIPPVAELSLDELRFPRHRRSPLKQELPLSMRQLETEVLRQENSQLRGEIDELRERLGSRGMRAEKAERQIEGLRAEVAELKTALYLMEIPKETVIEKVVEVPVVQKVRHAEAQRELDRATKLVLAMEAENHRLREILEKALVNQAVIPEEDMGVAEMAMLPPNASPAQKLDFILRQQEG